MNIKKIAIVFLTLILAATGAVCLFRMGKTEQNGKREGQMAEAAATNITTETKPALVVEARRHYEQLQKHVDAGDNVAFADYLLEHNVSQEVFALLVEEDAAAVKGVLVDAMLAYTENDQIEQLVLLRKNGYILDDYFLDYWEVMGSRLPEESMLDVDGYLIHELHMAYLRDSYTIRTYKQLREKGVLDDASHDALIALLGFDYTDDAYVKENALSPLQDLTVEDKHSYEKIQEYIDQGDVSSIIDALLYGSVTTQIYDRMMETDKEVLDYIIAEGMVRLMEEGRWHDLIQLRQQGFVSDYCFENYWEMLGSGMPGPGYTTENLSGEDGYLLFELEQIYYRYENGQEILQNIWASGAISDNLCYYLMDCLGFDFTQ